MNEALLRRISGEQDSRGKIGIFSRGKNIYRGGLRSAHSGKGYGMGRPKKQALERRMRSR